MTPLIFSCKSLPIKLIKLLLLPLKTMHEGVLASYNKFIVVILSLSICSLSLSRQLAYCIVQFLEKDPTLTEPVRQILLLNSFHF